MYLTAICKQVLISFYEIEFHAPAFHFHSTAMLVLLRYRKLKAGLFFVYLTAPRQRQLTDDCKTCGSKRELLFTMLPHYFPKETEENHENICPDSRPEGRLLKQGFPEYGTRVLSTCSVCKYMTSLQSLIIIIIIIIIIMFIKLCSAAHSTVSS
jgi:hypothetical protein